MKVASFIIKIFGMALMIIVSVYFGTWLSTYEPIHAKPADPFCDTPKVLREQIITPDSLTIMPGKRVKVPVRKWNEKMEDIE